MWCIDAIQPVKKRVRPTKSKRRARAPLPRNTSSVTRREYAEVVVRLGSVELQIQRNRAIIDLQTQRIAQLLEQINELKAAVATQSLAQEIPALPLIPTTPTVES